MRRPGLRAAVRRTFKSTKTKKRATLLGLPPELRNDILIKALAFDRIVVEQEPGISGSCRQTRREGKPIYYGINIFSFWYEEDSILDMFLSGLGEDGSVMVRDIRVGMDWCSTGPLDTESWMLKKHFRTAGVPELLRIVKIEFWNFEQMELISSYRFETFVKDLEKINSKIWPTVRWQASVLLGSQIAGRSLFKLQVMAKAAVEPEDAVISGLYYAKKGSTTVCAVHMHGDAREKANGPTIKRVHWRMATYRGPTVLKI